MRSARFSGIPGRETCATASDVFPHSQVFIPLFIIFAAVCLLLAGCNDETIVDPGNGNGDDPDGPVCCDSLPSVEILSPPADAVRLYPTQFQFTLRIEGYARAAGMRHLLVPVAWDEDGIAMLNEHPEDFDDHWSDWEKPAGEYATIQIGAGEPIGINRRYLFAVQVMDSCGRADSLFTHEKNARQFLTTIRYPTLTVLGKMLGSCSFYGTEMRPDPILVPPDVPLFFIWNGALSFDWMNFMEYRYGWDIQNLDDDEEWSTSWNPYVRQTFGRSFHSGVHILYIEVRDESGMTTHARIEIEIIPFRMDRDLLWVDDWKLGDTPLPNMMLPHEEAHDEFWTEICSRAPGFDPVTDIFPADELLGSLDGELIPLDLLSRYKHVVWTYSNSQENVWQYTIRFYPDPILGGFRPNTLALYLAGGGSVLTCGRSDLATGGLSVTFPTPPTFPASILDEYYTDGPAGPDPGRLTMAFDDYYVTVVDKVLGHFKTGEEFPDGYTRRIDADALRSAYLDPGLAGDLPLTLDLWEEVTKVGMFFDPMVRGFCYVEAYDPQYYMNYRGLSSHECFTPLYRMRARSTLSPLDHAAIALVATTPICEYWGRVGGESYHFGIPLWFFDHGQAEQIADYIFDRWDIR